MVQASRPSFLPRPAIVALLAVAAAFLLIAYGNDLRAQRGRQLSYWPSGKVRTQGEALRYPDGRLEKNGPYTEFHENGAIHLKGRYRQGKAEGPWREYDAGGVLRKEGSYREGKPHGRWHYYNPGATPQKEELEWDHGRVVENGRLVEVNENKSPAFPWRSHLLGTLWTLLWLAAPLPLLFALLGQPSNAGRAGSELSGQAGPISLAENMVALAVGWFTLQLVLILALALTGALATVPFFALEALLLAGGTLAWMRRGRPFPRLEISPPWRRDPALVAVAAAFAILSLAVVVKTLLMPMTDWDGLAYHLPLMAEWLQHHRLVDVPALGQTARYPSSWELISLGGYFPFGEDLLFTLPTVGAWSLLGLSIFTLARRFSSARAPGVPDEMTRAPRVREDAVTRLEAAAAALLFLSLPVVLLQTEELKADLPLAAVFLAALVLGGFLASTRWAPRWSLFWLSLALLCGTKASGPAYAVVALAAVGWWRWSSRRAVGGAARQEAAGVSSARNTVDEELLHHENRKDESHPGIFSLRPLFLLSLLWAVFLAAFWYLRNLVELGNPLGHVEFTLLDHTLFSGELSRAQLWHTTFFALFRPTHGADWSAILAAERQWLGLGMAVLTVSALVALVRGWSGKETRGTATALFLLLLTGGVLFGITPFSGDNGSHGWRITPWVGQALRYGLPKMAVLAVAAAWGWRSLRLPRWATASLTVALCAWSAALRVALPRPVLIAVVVLGGIFSLVILNWPGSEGSTPKKDRRGASSILSSRFFSSLRPWIRRGTLLLALAIFTVGLHLLREGRESRRQALYDLPYLHTLSAPKNEVVGVAMTQLRYPFYGHDLRRRVVDVSDHDLRKEIWLRRLDKEKVDVVAVGPRPMRRTFAPPEDDLLPWLNDPEGPFVRLPGVGSESGEGIVLFRRRRQECDDKEKKNASSSEVPAHSGASDSSQERHR